MTTLPPPISSTPSAPAVISRAIGKLAFCLDATGLEITNLEEIAPAVKLSVDDALALADFLRGPGVRQLVNRAWLASQHAAALDSAE